MALFKVNTGLREQEVVNLRWSWEVPVPELDTSVFIMPRSYVKNGLDRYVVLNRVAKSVINDRPSGHAEFISRARKGRDQDLQLGLEVARHLRRFRGSQTPLGPQVRSCHHALLGARNRRADLSLGEGVRTGLPQSPALAIVRARAESQAP